MCLYLVPGPVGSVSSIMDTTWAVISWSVPSYIPLDYPIITFEIGYHILQSGDCSMVDDDKIDVQHYNSLIQPISLHILLESIILMLCLVIFLVYVHTQTEDLVDGSLLLMRH